MRAVSWTHEPYHDLEQGRLPAIESLDAGFRKRSHRVANIATQDALATCGNAFAFEKREARNSMRSLQIGGTEWKVSPSRYSATVLVR